MELRFIIHLKMNLIGIIPLLEKIFRNQGDYLILMPCTFMKTLRNALNYLDYLILVMLILKVMKQVRQKLI